MAAVRILIAEDHAIVRTGIRLLLEAQPDLQVVAEAEDGRRCVELARQLRPDVILMDISMPGMNGFEATAVIRAEQPDVHILGLTMHEDERYFFRLLQAGASGYVVKGASPAELIGAIHAVHRGEAYLYPSLAKKLLDDYMQRVKTGEEGDSYGGLTAREREVLQLIAEGLTAREIADRLVLSAHTVDRHRANIMAKLGLQNKAQLIRYAIRRGLVSAER